MVVTVGRPRRVQLGGLVVDGAHHRLAATASSGSETAPMAGLQLHVEEEQPSLCCSSVVVPSETETDTESRPQHVQLISQLKLRDATVKERRRRLLGADMVAPVRNPRRAQLGVLVHGERKRDAAIATSEEARALDETLMRRAYKNAHLASTATSALHSSPTVATKFMTEVAPYKLCNMLDDESPIDHSCVMEQEEDPSILLQVEGILCSASSNALSESRLHGLFTDASLVDGERPTHHRAATAISEGETLELQRMKMQSGLSLLFPGPVKQQGTGASFLLQVDAPPLVDGGQQTHRPTGVCFATEMDSMLASIFVKHVAGQLVITIDLNECSAYLMSLYKQRTNTKLECQYFIYGRERLEPDSTLASYGVKGGSTIYVCSGLLGGADDPNLQDYITNNIDNFVKVVPLLDGRRSLQMTPLGCQFLSSWIRCFTRAFTSGRSWNGKFELVDFKVVKDHVRVIKKPKTHVDASSVGADITKLANIVDHILQFGRMGNLVSVYPPYVKSCLGILHNLVGSAGALAVVTGPFPSKYKLLLDNLVCCMTSDARETLVIQLYRKYEGANENESTLWDNAIKRANCPATWRKRLSNTAIFDCFIKKKANHDGKPYSKEKSGAFTLLRDMAIDGPDYIENANGQAFGDHIELMIPANGDLEEFLPNIIMNLIENNVDISAELSAGIHCACNICDP